MCSTRQRQRCNICMHIRTVACWGFWKRSDLSHPQRLCCTILSEVRPRKVVRHQRSFWHVIASDLYINWIGQWRLEDGRFTSKKAVKCCVFVDIYNQVLSTLSEIILISFRWMSYFDIKEKFCLFRFPHLLFLIRWIPDQNSIPKDVCHI